MTVPWKPAYASTPCRDEAAISSTDYLPPLLRCCSGYPLDMPTRAPRSRKRGLGPARVIRPGQFPPLRATVTGLRFFESPQQPAKRHYDDLFFYNAARYIYWELHLRHPALGRQTSFTVERDVWYAPGGEVAYRATRSFTLEPDWTESFVYSGARAWWEPRPWRTPSPRFRTPRVWSATASGGARTSPRFPAQGSDTGRSTSSDGAAAPIRSISWWTSRRWRLGGSPCG